MANVNTASIDLNPIVPYETSIFESGFNHVVLAMLKHKCYLQFMQNLNYMAIICIDVLGYRHQLG